MDLVGIIYVGSLLIFGVAFSVFLGVSSHNFELQREHQIAEQQGGVVEAPEAIGAGDKPHAV